MKKISIVLLAMLMVISMAACGGSESGGDTPASSAPQVSAAVQAAIDAIDDIGTVTVDSEEAIKNAEKLYGILTDSEKSQVTNRLALVEAREAFDVLSAEIIFKNAGDAYRKIAQAAEMCIDGMDDIYSIWRFGIYDADEAYTYNIFTKMALETSYTSDELEAAADNCYVTASDCVNGSFLWGDAWQCCLYVVMQAGDDRGDHTKISELLKEAEEILKEMGNNYSDYEHYPTLKQYYSKVASYAEFYDAPTGSFEQLKGTISDYENEIRTLKSDLEFVFKDIQLDEISDAVGL